MYDLTNFNLNKRDKKNNVQTTKLDIFPYIQ